jgi:hypothetical protein
MMLWSVASALAGGDLGLEALQPPAGDRLEAKPRRDRHLALARRRDQRQPLTPGRCEIESNGPDAQPAGVAPATAYLPLGRR